MRIIVYFIIVITAWLADRIWAMLHGMYSAQVSTLQMGDNTEQVAFARLFMANGGTIELVLILITLALLLLVWAVPIKKALREMKS